MIAEEELRAAARSGGSFKNNAPVLFINIPSKKFKGFLVGFLLNLFLSDKAAFSREG